MKRRDLLKSAMALAASPLIVLEADAFAKSGVINLFENPEKEVKGIPHFNDGRDWFFEKRFGLFIHWGIYSVAGWHEQHMYRRRLSRAGYAPLMREFNPSKFNPDTWLDLAEEAGMKYITFTTKHVDGFCMWDTKQTDYNVTQTPYAKDTLAILAEACHRRKVPLCLYYSLADMHQPNYPTAGRPYELPAPEPGDQPDIVRYMEFVKSQVRELCTNYGTIHGFWWDANVLKHYDPSINTMIRQLQPNAVINNRGCDDGDFGTPERDYQKDENITLNHPTEACQAVGMESWGYRKNEDYYNDRHLIRSIDKYLTRDANYLLNVGPDPLGLIPEQSQRILKNVGSWYKQVKESLEKVVPAPQLTSNKNVMLTTRGNTLYVHLNKESEGNVVKLRPFTVAPKSAVLLNNGQKVEFELEFAPQDHLVQQSYLRLTNLPTNELCNTVLVVKLEFDHPPEDYVHLVSKSEEVKDAQK
jgi:alpha-L-fucosidase